MCSSCCDDLPPVLDGPYPYTVGRAGSAFGGVVETVPLYQSEATTPTSEEELTEVSTAALEKQDMFAQPAELTRSPELHFARADD